jgi:aryl-alcohol dehydrogenase-like predicted oxidoreductase
METRTIPHTNLTVSRVSLGTMTFGGQCDEDTARAMVDLCLDQGVNFIDTANAYTGGAAEEITGRVLQGRRARVVLASKVGIAVGDADDQKGLSRRAILRAIDESLRRLRTDYLDIYYLHQPDPMVPLEESLEAMQHLVDAGKIRYIGASNYAAWQICRMQNHAKIHVAQPIYNLLSRGVEQEFFPMAKELQLYTIVYNPLAGGLLTGKYHNGVPQAGTRFEQNAAYMDRYWHRPNHDAVGQLRSRASAEGRSLTSVALNWILHHSPADGVVLGASRLAQLSENLGVLEEGPLAAPLVAACAEIWATLRGVAPQYNR